MNGTWQLFNMSGLELTQFKWKDKQKNCSLIKFSYFSGANLDKLRELVRKDSWGWGVQGLQSGEGLELLQVKDAEEYIKVSQAVGKITEEGASDLAGGPTTLGRILGGSL